MNSPAAADKLNRAQQIQQVFKWVVYSLLFLNWLFYIHEDWTRWTHTATETAGFFGFTSEFATSIDVSAWLLLIAMLELETYALDDETLDGWVTRILHGVRLLCFVMIAHTVWAFGNAVVAYEQTRAVDGVSDLCDLAGRGVSHVYNLEYTEVNETNCADLGTKGQIYWLGDNPLVTDLEGLELERKLAWADLIEVVVWLLILAAIEIVVRLQDRNITGGLLLWTMTKVKLALYAVLLGLGIYWAHLGHWLYFWDEILWIGGFAVIEMNVSDWRSEILDKQNLLTLPGGADD